MDFQNPFLCFVATCYIVRKERSIFYFFCTRKDQFLCVPQTILFEERHGEHMWTEKILCGPGPHKWSLVTQRKKRRERREKREKMDKREEKREKEKTCVCDQNQNSWSWSTQVFLDYIDPSIRPYGI